MKAWRVKGKIVSGVLNFASGKGYVFLCMLLSAGVLSLLHSFTMQNSGWWIGVAALFYALPHIVFRGIFKYREVPDGWLPGIYKAWRDRHDGIGFRNVKGNDINVNWKKSKATIIILAGYIVGLNGILSVIDDFGGKYAEYEIIALIIMTFVVPILYMKIFRQNLFRNNASVRFENIQRAKHGMHYKKWILAFIGFSIGMLPIMFLGGNTLLFIPIYFGVLIFFLKKAGSKFRGQIEFGGNRGGGVGGFRAPAGSLKESDWRDREQERRYDAKREWESKYGYRDY